MKTIAFITTIRTIVSVLLLAIMVIPQKTAAQNNSNNQLVIHEINTSKGIITVNLPSNIYAGDVISGTVISKPSGKNAKKQQNNAKIIEGYVFDTNESEINVSDGFIKLQIPEDLLTNNFPVFLNDASGRQVGAINVTVEGQAPFHFAEDAIGKIPPHFPEIIETGSPAVLTGLFDGDLTTTSVQLGENNSLILAESPRETIFQSPEKISGIHDITVSERNFVYQDEIRLVDLQLSATKTVLQKGEQTSIQMKVTGLENLA
jgi:hypothetical protein